jgi:hypothetical protein
MTGTDGDPPPFCVRVMRTVCFTRSSAQPFRLASEQKTTVCMPVVVLLFSRSAVRGIRPIAAHGAVSMRHLWQSAPV